jgi:hypothetical protein
VGLGVVLMRPPATAQMTRKRKRKRKRITKRQMPLLQVHPAG